MYADFGTLPLIQMIRDESLKKLAEFLENNYKEYEAKEKAEENKYLDLRDNQTKSTPLFYITSRNTDKGSVEIAKLLTEKYNLCSVNAKDVMKQTCLFYAAREGFSDLCKYLIKKGCKPNDADNFGQTSLFYAAREGKTSCVKLLIDEGANPNLIDLNKQTCLFYACRDGRYDTVKCLLENGSNPQIKDAQRRTAVTFAKGNGHLNIVYLIKNAKTLIKPDINTLNKTGSYGVLKKWSSSNLTGGTFCQTDSCNNVEPMIKDNMINYGMRKRYKLQYKPLEDDPLLWMDAPLVKINEFERRFPNLAVWPKDNNDLIHKEINNMNNIFSKQWYASANHLIQCLSKYEGGHIFEKLVDPKKQNCPDYYDVIKNPMSFNCIKIKLKKGHYKTPTEFINDVQLIFYNCNLYNSANSFVAITGKNIEMYFNNQLIVTGFNHYVAKENRINDLLKKVEEENNRWFEEQRQKNEVIEKNFAEGCDKNEVKVEKGS